MNKTFNQRPNKVIRKNKILALKCTPLEAVEIQQRAKEFNMTISGWLRELALNYKVKIKSLPKEVLLFQTRLNQVGAILNQLARKKNYNEPFNAIERAEISNLVSELHEIVKQIRIYMNDNQG